jgi:hypothetical protein
VSLLGGSLSTGQRMSDASAEPAPAPRGPAPALVCVDPARLHDVWPHVAPLIAQAMRRGQMGEVGDVERSLRSGMALLWLAWDGERILSAAVTELAAVAGDKVCTIVACGGRDFARFGHLIGGLEHYARQEGCTRMRICGRKGWARLLPDYAIRRVIIEKKI